MNLYELIVVNVRMRRTANSYEFVEGDVNSQLRTHMNSQDCECTGRNAWGAMECCDFTGMNSQNFTRL